MYPWWHDERLTATMNVYEGDMDWVEVDDNDLLLQLRWLKFCVKEYAMAILPLYISNLTTKTKTTTTNCIRYVSFLWTLRGDSGGWQKQDRIGWVSTWRAHEPDLVCALWHTKHAQRIRLRVKKQTQAKSWWGVKPTKKRRILTSACISHSHTTVTLGRLTTHLNGKGVIFFKITFLEQF